MFQFIRDTGPLVNEVETFCIEDVSLILAACLLLPGDFLRSHPEVLSAELLFNKVYREHPVELGKRVSRDERQTRNYNSPTLVYGEIDFIPFAVGACALVLLRVGGKC